MYTCNRTLTDCSISVYHIYIFRDIMSHLDHTYVHVQIFYVYDTCAYRGVSTYIASGIFTYVSHLCTHATIVCVWVRVFIKVHLY